MTVFRQKPSFSVSSARTAGRCNPAWRRKTPRFYPALFSTACFVVSQVLHFELSSMSRTLFDRLFLW